MHTQLVKPKHTNTDFEVRSLDEFQTEHPQKESPLSYLKYLLMGLSNLQLPSLIATISFMVGGFIMANLILPYILKL